MKRYAYCMYNPLRYIDPSGWLPGKPSNSRPDDPPGLGHYRPGIYNPTDSESAWLVCLPDVYVFATSDGYNRLVTAVARNLAGTQTYSSQAFDYDFRGNITQKTGVGSYAYDATSNRYAVTGLQPGTGQESLFPDQEATYTSFDKLQTLAQDGMTLSVDYGIDRQRVMQTFRRGGSTRTKRHFTPLYESITENGVTKNLHYLTAGTGLFAIFATQTNGASAIF